MPHASSPGASASMALPATMRAMVTRGHGGYEQLHYRDVPLPRPGPGEVLLQVLAAGINATDINTRVGWYASAQDGAAQQGWNGATPFPLIQGADCCGRVVALGPQPAQAAPSDTASPGGATKAPLALGQRVLVRSCMRSAGFGRWDTRWLGTDFAGAFAQYVVVPQQEAFAVQCDWSDAALATLPCAYGTAENMLQRAEVTATDHVLVTGASGGVGSAVVQLARCRGARVTAITQPDKMEAVRALGAEQVLARGADLSALQDRFSVLVDNVAGPAFGDLLATLQRGGRCVTSGAIAGAEVALDLRKLYLRDIRLLGCTAWSAEVFPRLVGYVERGLLQPLLAGTFPLSEMARAQQLFLEKRHLGNLVLIPD